MDGYILDSLLRRTFVFDDYQSFIWTERFFDTGDFELDIASTPANRALFPEGTLLALDITKSSRIMQVQTITDATDDDGNDVLKIIGPAIEDIFNGRVVYDSATNTETDPAWIITDTPGNIIRTMVKKVCVDGVISANDVIPEIEWGSLAPFNMSSAIPEYPTPIVWTQNLDQLMNPVKQLAQAFNLGFCLLRGNDDGKLYFQVYSGLDRTSRQTIVPVVIFSQQMDTLQGVTTVKDISTARDCAYVWGVEGPIEVKADDSLSETSGLARRVLLVNSEVQGDNPDITGAMTLEGKTALSAARASYLMDGEVNQYSQFKYGVDYNLGDLVDMRDADNNVFYKRITEQIFVCDENGERSYPTLANDVPIT